LATSKTEYYTLVPVTKLEKNGKTGNILGGSVGFEFQNEQGTAIAAVSLMDKEWYSWVRQAGKNVFCWRMHAQLYCCSNR
jgi:hypothetical protein